MIVKHSTDFGRPEFPAAQNWNDVPGYEMPIGDTLATQMSWKEFFNSPEFHQIIDNWANKQLFYKDNKNKWKAKFEVQ